MLSAASWTGSCADVVTTSVDMYFETDVLSFRFCLATISTKSVDVRIPWRALSSSTTTTEPMSFSSMTCAASSTSVSGVTVWISVDMSRATKMSSMGRLSRG